MSVASIQHSYVINPVYKENKDRQKNRVDKKTSELFGSCYGKLKEILIENMEADQDIWNTSLVAGFTAIPLTLASRGGVYTLAAVFSVCLIAVPYLRSAKESNDLILAFTDNAKSIKCFYNYFEDFKANPDEIKIKKIFDAFNEIFQDLTLIKKVIVYDLMNEDDLALFSSLGKLFIMEALTNTLRHKDENSLIAAKWQKTKDRTLKLDAPGDDFEPWKAIGISNPDLKYYRAFDKILPEFEFLQFAEKLVALFKACVENGLRKQIFVYRRFTD